MNLGVIFLVFVALCVGFYFYEQVKKKNQLYCIFRTPSKTREEKFVPLRSKYVIYRGGKYRVDPRRIQMTWWNRGILGMLGLGFWVPTLDFTWWTGQPFDPENFEITWESPEARNMLSTEEDIIDFAKGAPPVGGKKESTLQRLLPWIALAGVIIIGFMLFQLRGDIATLYELSQVK